RDLVRRRNFPPLQYGVIHWRLEVRLHLRKVGGKLAAARFYVFAERRPQIGGEFALGRAAKAAQCPPIILVAFKLALGGIKPVLVIKEFEFRNLRFGCEREPLLEL